MTDHPNLSAALAAFQADMPVIAKTKLAKAGSFSYAYADLADVAEVAMPRLASHGLSFTCAPRQTEAGGYELVGTLRHTSGDTYEGALPIKGAAQALGSDITYARRYLLSSMTGIVTEKDDDGMLAASQKQEKQERRAATTRTMSRKAPPQAPDGPQDAPDDGLRTEAQSKRMFALFREHGLTERDDVLARVTELVGRDVDSTKTLTKAEASKVIDSFGAQS